MKGGRFVTSTRSANRQPRESQNPQRVMAGICCRNAVTVTLMMLETWLWVPRGKPTGEWQKPAVAQCGNKVSETRNRIHAYPTEVLQCRAAQASTHLRSWYIYKSVYVYHALKLCIDLNVVGVRELVHSETGRDLGLRRTVVPLWRPYPPQLLSRENPLVTSPAKFRLVLLKFEGYNVHRVMGFRVPEPTSKPPLFSPMYLRVVSDIA